MIFKISWAQIKRQILILSGFSTFQSMKLEHAMFLEYTYIYIYRYYIPFFLFMKDDLGFVLAI